MEIQGFQEGEEVNFSTPILNAATEIESTEFQCDDGDWRAIRFGEGNETIELTVNANQLFLVEFIIFTTNNNEWGAVTDVMVTCTALDDDEDGIPNSEDNV